MKIKFLLLFLIFQGLSVYSNELTEDYFDMSAEYCLYGKYSEAMEYADKIIRLDPQNKDAYELKNTILRITNKNSKSYLSTINKTIGEAVTQKKLGQKNKELSILVASSDNFWPCFTLAQVYRENNDYNNAIAYYKKSIHLKPNLSQSYLGISKTYIKQKDYQNALNSLNKYISYNPNSDIAYALRAEVYMNLNNLTDAENDIKKALEIEENISYLLTEAKIFYYQGKYEDAKIKLNLLSRNIQTSDVFEFLGLCYYAEKDYTQALLNIDKAIILSDDDKNLNSTYNNIKQMLEK